MLESRAHQVGLRKHVKTVLILFRQTMTDYDATAHIAEEAKNPAVIVPQAISMALTFTYVVGWLFNIVLVFCMGDPAVILASPIAQPVSHRSRVCPSL